MRETKKKELSVLHVAPEGYFTSSMQKLISENFSEREHFFLKINNNRIKANIGEYSNSITYEGRGIQKIKYYLAAIIKMHRFRKIVLHSLGDPRIVVLLFTMPWLIKKCSWVIWGYDLYDCKLGKKNLLWQLREFFRRPVIERIPVITTTVPGDFKLAKEWYGNHGRFIHNLMYPSHLHRNTEGIICQKYDNDSIYIQVGNSSAPSNNHMEIFELLSKNINKNRNLKIFCPLSYGDDAYRGFIVEKGYDLFGENFTPILELMDFDSYNSYLASIDIAIFNHDRQQGMGNIIGLLSLGKKVILKSNVTSYAFLKSINIAISSLDDPYLLKKLTSNESEKNINIMSKYFTKDRLISNWKEVFES